MVAHRDPGAKGRADNARIAYQSKILVSVNEMVLKSVAHLSSEPGGLISPKPGDLGTDAKSKLALKARFEPESCLVLEPGHVLSALKWISPFPGLNHGFTARLRSICPFPTGRI
jgi:hypothetical protein